MNLEEQNHIDAIKLAISLLVEYLHSENPDHYKAKMDAYLRPRLDDPNGNKEILALTEKLLGRHR